MNISRLKLEQRLAHFQRSLKKAGVKLTPQRLEVFREVVKADDHPDAETIHRRLQRRMPSLSLDTVYRTLWLLRDLGLIEVLPSPRLGMRFDGNPHPHCHFVCQQCGRVADLFWPGLPHLPLPQVAKKYGRMEKIQVEMRGICFRCSQEINPKTCVKRKKEEKRWKP